MTVAWQVRSSPDQESKRAARLRATPRIVPFGNALLHVERLSAGRRAGRAHFNCVRTDWPLGRLEDVELGPRRASRRHHLAVSGDENRVLESPARLDRHALRGAF